MSTAVNVIEKEAKMARGRRAKPQKPKTPTRLERLLKVRDKMIGLKDELVSDGFGSHLKPPGAVKLLAPPLTDPKTGGTIGHVHEAPCIYLSLSSPACNFSLRPPFLAPVAP